MRIAEIYQSVQGEGLLTGTESVFVRTSGCNLRCIYCDTPYASWNPEGDDLSVDDVLLAVQDWVCRHVVLTGGEPMLFAELIPLCDGLQALGKRITIETAGTLYLPLACDLMSISPKLSNSTPPADKYPAWHSRHERTRRAPEIVRRLVSEYPYQLKFVVDRPSDADEVARFLDELPEVQRERVLLMPAGTTVEQLQRVASWLVPHCAASGLRYCPRRQIEWYGLTRRT